MSRPVEVQVTDQRLRLDRESLQRGIAILDRNSGFTIPAGSLGIAFVSPAECSRLHKRFFDDPDVTDVMTFPGDPEDQHAGDIAICPHSAASACRETGLPFHTELSLYLVHAWLHLAGLDDRDAPSRVEMRHAEALLLDELASKGALLACSWNS